MSKIDEIRARHDTCADRGTTMYADRAYLLERIAELEVDLRLTQQAREENVARAEAAEAALERVRGLPEKWRDVWLYAEEDGSFGRQSQYVAYHCADELAAALKEGE